ncbi:hypothetical protein ACFL6M_07710, partial [Candidatus Eisenbacteria bacterium]
TVTFERKTQEVLPFKRAQIHTRIIGSWLNDGAQDPYAAVSEFWWDARGSFDGEGKFTGQVDPAISGEGSTGTVTVTLDLETLAVSGFTGDLWMHDEPTGDDRESHIVGNSLPQTEYEQGQHLVCKTDGEGTCGAIDEMSWDWNRVEGIGQELVGFSCETGSVIEITFVK